MKPFLGLLLIAGGICLGAWAGIWWAFVGGIVDVINEVRAAELNAMNVAVGVAKVMFAGVIGVGLGTVAVLSGLALMASDS